MPKTAAQRRARKRSRHNHVTVTYADGTQELRKPGAFKPVPKTLRGRYEQYIRSPEWRALRKRVLRRDKRLCTRCGADGPKLQIHHLTYERFGDERLEDLATVCDPCHVAVHS